MSKHMKYTILACVLLAGCTDSAIANLEAIGSPGDVTCYSGNMVIYQGRSTGKIATIERSDGWEFMDAATHRLVRISGPCVIKN